MSSMEKRKPVRFAIWGCGGRGRQLALEMGKEYIAVIIDVNGDIQGTCVDGIPIVSPDTFYKEYVKYPVIVTPKGYEEEIIDELKENNVKLYFAYNDVFFELEFFIVQQVLEKIISGSGHKGKWMLQGYSALNLAICNFLTRKALNFEWVFLDENHEASEHLRKYYSISCLGYMPECEEEGIWLITKKPFRAVRSERHIDLCNLECFRTKAFCRNIRKFENVHKGKRCFIVATGPSLKSEDLEKLYLEKEICISLNSILRLYDRTNWRPDYYIISDPIGTYQWENEIVNMDVKDIFVSDIGWRRRFDNCSKIHKWHYIRKRELAEKRIVGFSSDFSEGGYSGGTITYEGGIQLAAYMGFTEIYLYGVDCCNYGKKTKHFEGFDENKDFKGTLAIEANIAAYKEAKKYADSHGIKIFNATRGGELEIFERVNFDNLF